MSDEHGARVAVVETRLNHLEDMIAQRFGDLKRLIERQDADRKEEKRAELEERRARGQREWSLIIAFLVAALGFLTNAISRAIGL